MTAIIEEYDLIQQEDVVNHRQLSGGVVCRKSEKFSVVLPDGVEVILFFKGTEEAINARFGTWGLGMVPPAEVRITVKPLGSVIAAAVLSRQTPAPAAPVPTPTPPAPVKEDEEEEKETDAILRELDELL